MKFVSLFAGKVHHKKLVVLICTFRILHRPESESGGQAEESSNFVLATSLKVTVIDLAVKQALIVLVMPFEEEVE